MLKFKSEDQVEISPGENSVCGNLLKELRREYNYISVTKGNIRAELIPCNDEWWISPEEHPEKWELCAEQDINWEQERKIRMAACQWWKEHVFIDKKIDYLSNGYYKLKRCEVKNLYADTEVVLDSSKVGTMWNNSRVVEMRGDSRIDMMRDNSQIDEMRNNSCVGMMRKNSWVSYMEDNSKVDKMIDSSKVYEAYGNSWIGEMRDSSRINSISDDSRVDTMQNNSRIEMMTGRSRIGIMLGNSQVDKVEDMSLVETMGDNSRIVEITDDSQVGKMRGNSIAINFNFFYPYILKSHENEFKTVYKE